MRRKGEHASSSRVGAGSLIPGESIVYAGSQDFAAPNLAQFNEDLIKRLLALHVQGMLGADFLTTHDVLVDYGAHRVFVSRSRNAKEPPAEANRWMLIGSGSHGPTARANGPLNRQCLVDGVQSASVPLSAKGRRLYVSASLSGADSPGWDMRLDTWATRSTSRSKKVAVGVEADRLVGAHFTAAGSTFSADQVEAKVNLATDVALDLKPVATEETESILGSDAFQGHTILLQFRKARFRLWAESVMSAFSASSGR